MTLTQDEPLKIQIKNKQQQFVVENSNYFYIDTTECKDVALKLGNIVINKTIVVSITQMY